MLTEQGTTDKLLNILVAEDEADTRQVISVLLTRPGHVVHAVSDGLEAIRSLTERRYDILIADLKMPRMDGLALLRKARELCPGMACIVLTGHSNREHAMEALELEVFDFIAKPFMIDQLLPAIGRIAQKTATIPSARFAFITAEEIPDLVGYLMRQGELVGPVRNGKSHSFAPILDVRDAVLEYTSTILPPKKFFLPPEEPLFEYDRKLGSAKPEVRPQHKRILFAVHSCDMQAIDRLDQVFAGENPEPGYVQRRRATSIIGASCIPDDKCFCRVMGAHRGREGFDAFIARCGDGYRIDILSPNGAQLLSGFREPRDVSAGQIEAFGGDGGDPGFQAGFGCNSASLPELLRLAQDDELWSKLGDDCLSCGSCTMVCPTCHCFDVQDYPLLDGRTGTRRRRWDSCQLECFASVAGGENFRKTRAERVHHRFAHKFSYFHEKTGMAMCVGCGRCARACPSNIGPAAVLRQLCANHRNSLLLRAYNFWQ